MSRLLNTRHKVETLLVTTKLKITSSLVGVPQSADTVGTLAPDNWLRGLGTA